MKYIGLIGSLTLDDLTLFSGERFNGYGGVYYSLATLSLILGEKARLYPLMWVGTDIIETFKKDLSVFTNISNSGLLCFKGPTNRVRSFYSLPDKRHEFSDNIFPAVPRSRIDVTIPFSIFIINFVSGREMSFLTYSLVREIISCTICLDIHSLVLGRRQDGERFYRRPAHWKGWISGCDILQANQQETEVLYGKALINEGDFRSMGAYFLSLGPKIILVTLGNKGSVLIYKNNKAVKVIFIPANISGNYPDVPGCGDVFGASFIAHYILYKKPEEAAHFAARVAGKKLTMPGSENMTELKEFRL